jgi:hypothetical protein
MIYTLIGRSIVRVQIVGGYSDLLLVKDDEGREYQVSEVCSLGKAVNTLYVPNRKFFVDGNTVYECVPQPESYQYDEEGQSLKVEVLDDEGKSSVITVHPDEVRAYPNSIMAAIERYYN